MSTPLIGPDGRQYTLTKDDPEALKRAEEAGYRVETPDAPQTLLEGVKETAGDVAGPLNAATIGALQGVTAGGYGTLIGNTEAAETKAAVLKAMEENPIAAGVGELAGMVVSPLNKLMPAVEGTRAATVLGRLGQKSLSGAAIGTLYGAGNTVSDAALGDAPLTAEKLVAGAGLGALLGGLGGGIGGAIEEGAALVLPKLATIVRGSQSILDDVANDAAISSTRATQNVINRIGDEKLANVARVLRDNGHLRLTPEAMAESVAKHRETLGKTLGKVIDDLDAAGAKVDHTRLAQRLDDFEKSLDPISRKTIASDLADAKSAVAEMAAKGDNFRALDVVKQKIQTRGKFSRGAIGTDDLTLQLKRNLAGVVRDELDQQILPAIGSDAGKAFTEAKATYGALRDAERLAESGMSRVGERGNLAFIGLKDLMAGAAGAAVHPLGMGAALGSKVLRDHGAAIVARVADKLAKSPALKAVAASFAVTLPASVPQLGAYGPALALAAQRSPELALAQHIVTAQLDPEYAANAQMAGLRPETPDEHVASMGRATDLAAMRGALKAQDEAIDEALSRVVKGHKPPKTSPVLKTQDFGSKRMRQTSIEGHRRRVDEIRMLATDPQALVDRVAANTAGLGDAAPAATAQMTALAQRAVAYLAQQAEAPPKPGPLARERTPTEADRHLFSLKLQAVQSPMSILDAAARGTLVRAQIDAVRAVYPSLARAIEDRALEQLATGEQMPYRARLMLSMLTGVDADGTMSPMAIAANQNAIASASGKPSEKMPAPTGDGDNINGASRMAMPGQRKELESEAV